MLRAHATVLVLAVALGAPPAFGQANPSLGACQKTMAKESATYVRSVVQAVDKCLAKMSTAVVQGGATSAAAANATRAYCAAAFARLANGGGAKELGTLFDAKVGRSCDAAVWDGMLGAASLGEYCATFGGDGSVDDLAEWKSCVRAAADAEARAVIATRWPRALEYFSALADALPASAARTALVALDAAIEGSIDDDMPDPPPARTGLLDTGASQCIVGAPFSIFLEPCVRGPKDQDGFAQAGLDARYTDNGDGTITDEVTGLTWEKLGDDGSVHDRDDVATLADAIGLKIASLNAGGFAGHTDWRLPNRRELESLIDAGAFDPAIRPSFDDACASGCSAAACSCTLPERYWTSTAYQADPSKGWVVDFRQGLVLPNALNATAHVRAVRGGSHVGAPSVAKAAGKAPASVAACQKVVATESAKYVRTVVDTAGKCLDAMSAVVVGRGATPADAARTAGRTCVAAFGKLVNAPSATRALGARFDAKVAAKCDPAVDPRLAHLDADTWTIGGRTLAAANLGAYCAQFDGDGVISSFAEWQRCVRSAADAQVREAIALRWPRALEYFAALEAELASSTATDALAALVALDGAIEGTTDDDRPEPPPPPPAGLLVTGQTQCVQDDLATLGPCPGGLAGQDGEVQAGIARRYTDNGDGTITDGVTGLMWEKLGDDDSIHDRDHGYLREGAHLNKVARLNRKTFAGYSDWRVPNRRELESLVDAGRVAPAIDPIFDHDCIAGCSVLECSCTASGPYRSSTYQPFYVGGRAEQVDVDFSDGAVRFVGDPTGGSPLLDAAFQHVRAVRGGNAPATTIANLPPVAGNTDVKIPISMVGGCLPISFFGKDPDSTVVYLEIVTFPEHGFFDLYEFPGAPVPETTANGQIGASLPDVGVFNWGPYDYKVSTDVAGGGITGWNAKTYCYVPFSDTFTGVDSFTYRVRDNEGSASEIALVTLTIFDDRSTFPVY